ncbi:MAG TPA: septation protein SepH [Micromonosporaceae bacterium]|nr:septation protein SepH [Micromonosporaceae bacterium]
MRPVRFVALSEDGQALVLADEVGRLLSLPIDERISSVMRVDRSAPREVINQEDPPSLAPRDIQARIRAGDSAEDVARIAGVPVDRVLRYAGPVLQERAMLAQHARRTKLKTSETGATLAEVVDAKLSQHGVDMEKVSWDAYRRDDGTWRVVATWPSGKTNATAMFELDKARQLVSPCDDMANYLCGTQASQDTNRGHEVAPPRPDRSGHEPMFPGQPARPGRDPIRAGRDALLASLERPLGAPATRSLDPVASTQVGSAASAAATGETPRRRGVRAFYEEEHDSRPEVPAVPSLAVLRPRRTAPDAPSGDRPAKRGPNWEDILFGAAPETRRS